MPLVNLVVTLIVGVVLLLVRICFPTDRRSGSILNRLAVVAVALWPLQGTGLPGGPKGIRVGG